MLQLVDGPMAPPAPPGEQQLAPPPPSPLHPRDEAAALQRRLSALQQLSRDIERDVSELLPLRAEGGAAADDSEPLLEISRVPGDDGYVDVHISHHFRARLSQQPAGGSGAADGTPLALMPAAGQGALQVEALQRSGGGGDAPGGEALAGQLAAAAGLAPGRTLASRHIERPDSSGPPSRAASTAPSETPHTGSSLGSLQGGAPRHSQHARTASDGSGTGTPSLLGEARAWATPHARSSSGGNAPPPPPPASASSPRPPSSRAASSARGSQASDAPSQPSSSCGQAREFEIDPRDVLVGERIAIGGFAEVFMGRYRGALVAIKVLTSVDEQGQERFRQEVQMLESVRHPNIVLFMGFATHPHLAIVSEFCHRGSLFKLLRRGGDVPLEPRMQRSVAVSVASGMHYMHGHAPPLMHLDLKSPNILLDAHWRVKIADFGLSRVRSHTLVSGTGAGTPEWMAPEVLRSEGFDERADVYSYGVVLWECLTGRQPWEGMHPMQVVGAVGFLGRQLDPPPRDDPFLADLCVRCMAQDPRQRPFFREILQLLEEHYESSRHSSLASQHALSEGHLVLESGSGSGHRRGDARELPPMPSRVLSTPALPALRLPSGVKRARVPGGGPAGPARGTAEGAASPFGGPQAQLAGAAPGPAGAQGLAGQLHHQLSLSNASPFAQLPPFDDGDGAVATLPAARAPTAARQLTLHEHLQRQASAAAPAGAAPSASPVQPPAREAGPGRTLSSKLTSSTTDTDTASIITTAAAWSSLDAAHL